ncbi:sensor domain-containing diguanylate cyclase [Piscibacillus halophilus]|uniref:PAS domain S-box-containing protein/diguanylate cyclase (GGDEF) domain-containing protein n=1 Tax=Piscibacillus halophilus TaxID=571933 RepID=A0A1H9DNA7_9BACI|nr:diguanylate cyclase [Piscibacillus halophilus]SEQ14964.1 PAS domain S-box-containing protein/diguanylate cyclase (GGDEF) domain-containing protein [Piscibacillus halophilus]
MSELVNVQHLLKEQSRIIEMLVAENLPLSKILERLTETIAVVFPDVRATITEYNEKLHSLENPIGPRFPRAYLDSMDGLSVGPKAGSCGTSAYINDLVIVEDAMVDPIWEDYRDIVETYNIKGCWSIPIVSATGHLFGTLAFYPDECRAPSQEEVQVFNQFSHLAAMIIDKKRSEEALRLANRVIENSPAVIIRWKAEKGWPIDYVSNNINQFGYTPGLFLKEKIDFSLIVHPKDLARVEGEVDEYLERGLDKFKQEYRIITADGKIRWIDDRTTVTRNEHREILYIEGVLIDITERKEAEQQVFYLANNDPLTGIPNRRYFKKKLEKELTKSGHTGDHLAILYIDCDNFKQINDDLGHDTGDEFLQHLSKRLRNCLREDDIIARIGGDEFNVLLTGVEKEKDVLKVAERLIRASSEPWEIKGNVYHVTISIGVAIAPMDGTSVDDLIRKADRALYQAKASGKNQLMWYIPKMSI